MYKIHLIKPNFWKTSQTKQTADEQRKTKTLKNLINNPENNVEASKIQKTTRMKNYYEFIQKSLKKTMKTEIHLRNTFQAKKCFIKSCKSCPSEGNMIVPQQLSLDSPLYSNFIPTWFSFKHSKHHCVNFSMNVRLFQSNNNPKKILSLWIFCLIWQQLLNAKCFTFFFGCCKYSGIFCVKLSKNVKKYSKYVGLSWEFEKIGESCKHNFCGKSEEKS